MSDSQYIRHLQDKQQALVLAGDALASIVAAYLPDHALLELWDKAKHHGEVEAAR
jgi:hypothetical protein